MQRSGRGRAPLADADGDFLAEAKGRSGPRALAEGCDRTLRAVHDLPSEFVTDALLCRPRERQPISPMAPPTPSPDRARNRRSPYTRTPMPEIAAPKGTRDILPDEFAARRWLLEAHSAVAESFGYRGDRNPGHRGDGAVQPRRRDGHGHRREADVHVRRPWRALADAPSGGHRRHAPRRARRTPRPGDAPRPRALCRPVLPRRTAPGGPAAPVHPGRHRVHRRRLACARRGDHRGRLALLTSARHLRHPPAGQLARQPGGSRPLSQRAGRVLHPARGIALRRLPPPPAHQPAPSARLQARRRPGRSGAAALGLAGPTEPGPLHRRSARPRGGGHRRDPQRPAGARARLLRRHRLRVLARRPSGGAELARWGRSVRRACRAARLSGNPGDRLCAWGRADPHGRPRARDHPCTSGGGRCARVLGGA